MEYSISNVAFKCERCGKCCKYRGDLALTPMDVFQIAKHLNISCEEMVRKYTRLSHKHYFPQILIEGINKQAICIFYDRRIGCSIYPVRPASCYLFPLTPLTAITVAEPKFAIRQCHSKIKATESVPVMDWIRNASQRYEAEKAIFSWYMQQQTLIDAFCSIHREKLQVVKALLYYRYDLSGDMESQIKNNINEILFGLF